MKKILQVRVLAVCMLYVSQQHAATSIETPYEFYKTLSKYSLVITNFYFKDKALEKDKVLYSRYKSDNAIFNETDNIHRFVKFIKVNIERKKLRELKKQFNIEKAPTFVLFRNGNAVASKSFNSGSVEISSLHEFILEHFKENIEKMAKEEKKRRRQWLLRNPYYYRGFIYYTPSYYYCPYHYGYHPYNFACPFRNRIIIRY